MISAHSPFARTIGQRIPSSGRSEVMYEAKNPHPVDIVVGARLRAARVAAGLTQTALAERIGVTFQQIQKYERGANRLSASKLVDIAETLQIPAPEFLTGLGGTPRPDAGHPDLTASGADELLRLYAQLPGQHQSALISLARSLTT
jgi:transcriptional regulator with XRE-family HTH domain